MKPQLAALTAADPNFRFEFHQRVLWPDRSQLPAEASECAADQGKFFEYSELLFKNQNAKGFTNEQLISFAGQLNLDTTTFTPCLESHKYKGAVEAESNAATAKGIKSTPTFEINGKRFTPQKSYDELISAAKAELAKVKK